MSASSMKHNGGFSYWLYRLLLCCYPVQFRRLYAREMANTFRDSYREVVWQHGRKGVLRLWGIVLYDLGISLFIEYLSAFKELLNPIEERHGKYYMSFMNIVSPHRAHIGLKRQLNEDSVISILPEDQQVLESKGILFVVADGMGGHSRGEVPSQLAVNTIRDFYYQQETDDPQTSLRMSLEQPNGRLYGGTMSSSPKLAA